MCNLDSIEMNEWMDCLFFSLCFVGWSVLVTKACRGIGHSSDFVTFMKFSTLLMHTSLVTHHHAN
jgi:hypothetical protein